MIKDVEIAMVNAATFALEYQDKKYTADAHEIIKEYMKESNYLNIKSDVKIYSVAAISEILKLKRDKANKGKTNKQLMQMFVRSIPELSRKMKEGDDY